MTSDRIKEILMTTAYPESVSIKQALLQVWNECEQDYKQALIEQAKAHDQEICKRIEQACDSSYMQDENGSWIKYDYNFGTDKVIEECVAKNTTDLLKLLREGQQ